MARSATARSRPIKYALCLWICSTSDTNGPSVPYPGMLTKIHVPTCSFPLNTYNLHPTDGFRASGGSWYLSTVLVPSPCLTVFVAAARRPEGLKFGFALSSVESSGFDAERERSLDSELRP